MQINKKKSLLQSGVSHLIGLFTLIGMVVLGACQSYAPIYTDMHGNRVDPDTIKCKSLGRVTTTVSWMSKQDDDNGHMQINPELVQQARGIGATHLRWTYLGASGYSPNNAADAYRCIYQTKEFKRHFADYQER